MQKPAIEIVRGTLTVNVAENDRFVAHPETKETPAFVECIAENESYKRINCQDHFQATKIAVSLAERYACNDIEEFAEWIECQYPEDVNEAA